MRFQALLFAPAMALALTMAPLTPAHATIETPEAKAEAAEAASDARWHMRKSFGTRELRNGQFRWREGATEVSEVVVSLTDQMAYAYHEGELVGVSTVSTGTDEHPTPTGIFPILEKQRHYRSRKYDDAPMPFMQRLDNYGIALHAGRLPGYRASHGCIRLPTGFASRLFQATDVGTRVLIGA